MGKSDSLRAPALFLVLLAFGARLEARPEYLDLWKAKYPESTLPERMKRETGQSCTICHSLGGYNYQLPGNCYRESIHQVMHEAGGMAYFQLALDAVDGMDSDADGVPNGIEILSARPDGEVGDHPGLAGMPGVDRCGTSGDEVVSSGPETPPLVPGIRAVPQVMSFGDLASGEAARRILVFRNAGSTARTVTGLSIGRGLHSGDSVEAVGSLPRRLYPGEELVVIATFRASYGGYFYQQLAYPEISTDDPPSGKVGALLRPRRGFPGIGFPFAVDLGIAAVGEAGMGSISITNADTTPITILNAHWIDGAPFGLVNEIAGRKIDSRGVLMSGVRYSPAEEGVHRDFLTIETDHPIEGVLTISVGGEARHRLTPGDANLDRLIDLGDAIAVLWALFVDGGHPCPEALDANDNGEANIADAVFLLELLFLDGGPLPQECRLEIAKHYLGCPGGSPPCSGVLP